jgi:hypothetical protein
MKSALKPLALFAGALLIAGLSPLHAAYPEKPVRVVRLSNVAGRDLTSDNFIYALLREALASGTIIASFARTLKQLSTLA